MLPPRITGTEMEWSILVQNKPGQQPIIPEAFPMKSYISGYIPDGLVGSDSFYSNGSRLYIDIGDHVEYATPEDDSFVGTTANEIAGERILYHIMNKAQQKGQVHDFALNKRVIDEIGTTWGYHESYCADATALSIDADSLALLGVHMATRSLFVGAGVVRNSPRGPTFFIAQKSAQLNNDYCSSTTQNSKPVVNLRNEPHADSEKWLRVHVTSGDPNMSPWATIMKLGTTSLVLRLIEHGDTLEHIRVKSLRDLARQVATDLSLKDVVLLESGKSIKPSEIQTELYSAARELAEVVELPEEEQMVLDWWEVACDEIKVDPMLLRNRADWVAKKLKLDCYCETHGLEMDAKETFRKDRQWDHISPKGIGINLRKKLWQKWMPDESLIDSRITEPPTNTRAAVRGRFVGEFAGVAKIDWSKVNYAEDTIHLGDPYASSNQRVDQLIARVKTVEKVA